MSHDLESNPSTQTNPLSTEELRDRVLPDNPNKNTFFDRHLNTRLKKFAAMTALGATLAGGGIVGGMYAENARAEKDQAPAAAPAVPGQSVSASPEASSSATPSATAETASPQPTSLPGETAGTKQEVLVQQLSIEAMDAMDIKTFAKLPLADRAAYAYTKASSAHTIDVNNNVPPMMIPGYWQEFLNEAAWSKDKVVGEKIASAIYQSPVDSQTGEFTMSYKAITKLTDELNGSQTVMNDKYHYEGHGSTLVDPDNGKTYTNITFSMKDNSGAVMSPTETDQVFEDVVKLSDGRTVKVFTQGRGVLGQESPVPANQY